ncbi:MAG: MATE family efflux transporter, partial [Angelakisella sp.]
TGVGLNSLVSRRLGEQNQKSADLAATHGVLLGVVNGLFCALLAIFATKPFFRSFSDDPALVELAVQYGEVILLCSFSVFISINLEKILQATGNMMDPMKIMLIGTVTNLVLDPIMIFGLLGCPAMGVRGAAIATVIGQLFSMLFALWVCVDKKRTHRVTITMRGFHIHWKTVGDIYKVGLPSIVMQSIGSVMVAGMNMILIGFSQAAVSVLGIYFKLQSFIFMPVFGLTSGVMPIMGYSYGARNRKRLMASLWYGLGIAAVIMTIGTVLFVTLPAQFLAIFSADSEMLRIGIPALRIISLCFIPAAAGIMISTIFQAVGMGMQSLVISVMRQILIILPLAAWLSQFGVFYVWFAMPAAELIAFVVAVTYFRHIYKTQISALSQD